MFETLIVKKKNEATLYVDCDPGAGRELSDFFTFYVPGYKFMPAYKNKVWDGKIRLYDSRTKELPAGLFYYLSEFANVREYNILLEDSSDYGRPGAIDEINEAEITKFIEGLNLTAKGQPIEPRDYQIEALIYALTNKRGVLLSPTASGKSLIIYMIIKYYLSMVSDGSKKVLIIVPTTSLVEQMYSDFKDYGMLVENSCHRIYSGKDKDNINGAVVISTWQSVYKLPQTWFEQFGCVIGDEAHNFKAKSLTTIMTKCTEASHRIGTTGTLDGTQTHKLVLEGLFGPIHKVITTKELMDKDAVAQLDISVILLKYQEQYCREISKAKYQEEVDFIVSYEPRNRFIRNLALDLEGNTLVLFNYVEKHGKPLFRMIEDKAKDGRKVFFVSGQVDVDSRERIRAITERETNAIIVASLGTFSTGINIRNLHNVCFASPSKSQIKVLQSIGRGLRKSDDGRNTRLFDIADDLHWKSSKNYTLEHAAIRIQMYTKEHFDYKVYEVELKDV